jgi:predicted nuclease of predicted toxin-antitoxin system
MLIWVDAQLSPSLAPWLAENFQVEAYSVKFLGLRDATDDEIFDAARAAAAVVLTKDRDFLRLVERRGIPPQVLLLTLGNTSNVKLRSVLSTLFHQAESLLLSGDAVVEIGDSP